MLVNIKREDLLELFKLDIEFTEEYRRGVNENWGGRPIAIYELLYKVLHEAREHNLVDTHHPNYTYPYTFKEAIQYIGTH